MLDPYVLIQSLSDGCQSRINCIAFSPNGQLFATGNDQGGIRIWEPREGSLLYSIDAESPILCFKWNPNHGSGLFYGCQDGTVAYLTNFTQVRSNDNRSWLNFVDLRAPPSSRLRVRLSLVIPQHRPMPSRLTNKQAALGYLLDPKFALRIISSKVCY